MDRGMDLQSVQYNIVTNEKERESKEFSVARRADGAVYQPI
jgi:hypothetical protein